MFYAGLWQMFFPLCPSVNEGIRELVISWKHVSVHVLDFAVSSEISVFAISSEITFDYYA